MHASMKLPIKRQLRKEASMGMQLDLFERQERVWTERVWNSLLPETREEIVNLLARMATTKVRASGPRRKGKRKGVRHDA